MKLLKKNIIRWFFSALSNGDGLIHGFLVGVFGGLTLFGFLVAIKKKLLSF